MFASKGLDWREQKRHAGDYYTDGHSASARGQLHRLPDPVSSYIVLPGCRIQIMIVGLTAQVVRAARKRDREWGLLKGRGLGEMVKVGEKEVTRTSASLYALDL